MPESRRRPAFIQARVLVAAFLALRSFAVVAAADVQEFPLQVAIKDLQGRPWTMPGRLCRPAGTQAAHLVVINHGSIADASVRREMQPDPCASAAARWFVQRGFAVVFVMRLGHGVGGSPWTESFHCTTDGFYQSGMETARQIATIVDATTRLPNIVANDAIVIGVSAGGWGAIAYDAQAHAHVAAIINMSGGRGGHFRNQVDRNCHPEALIEAAGRFGKTATTPMLWVYARNDSFFGPELSRRLSDAFTTAGAQTRYVLTAPLDDEGHALFAASEGVALWAPAVESYLVERGLLPPAARP